MTEEQFNLSMEGIRNKDKQALKVIYEEYIDFIYHVVLDVVKNREAAEDITSEFFIRLWEKADQYRAGNGHKGYLATIARNMAIDYIRKNKHEELSLDKENEDGGDNYSIPSEDTPVEQQVVGEVSIEQALNSLKPVYREIVTMKVLGDLTFREISKAMNIPIGTVTWNYREAIKQLRRLGYE